MAGEDAQLKLRISAEMREHLEESARINGRSLNAEVVSRLTQSLDRFSSFEKVGRQIEQLREKDEQQQVELDTLFRDLEKLFATVQKHDEQLNPLKYDEK